MVLFQDRIGAGALGFVSNLELGVGRGRSAVRRVLALYNLALSP